MQRLIRTRKCSRVRVSVSLKLRRLFGVSGVAPVMRLLWEEVAGSNPATRLFGRNKLDRASAF